MKHNLRISIEVTFSDSNNLLSDKLGYNAYKAFYGEFHGFWQANFPMVVRFQAQPIFNTAPVASKNTAKFKSGQN